MEKWWFWVVKGTGCAGVERATVSMWRRIALLNFILSFFSAFAQKNMHCCCGSGRLCQDPSVCGWSGFSNFCKNLWTKSVVGIKFTWTLLKILWVLWETVDDLPIFDAQNNDLVDCSFWRWCEKKRWFSFGSLGAYARRATPIKNKFLKKITWRSVSRYNCFYIMWLCSIMF